MPDEGESGRYRLEEGFANFTAVPNEVLRSTAISGNAKALYAIIIDAAFRRASPTQEDLGLLLGGGVKLARSTLRELHDAGLLEAVRPGQGEPNYYLLMRPKGTSDPPLIGPEGTSGSANGAHPSVLVEDLVKDKPSQAVKDVYDYWREKRSKARSTYDRISDQRRQKIKARLREFSADELKGAIDAVARDPWPERALHDDITVIFRSREQVERFLEMRDVRAGPQQTPWDRSMAWVRNVGWQLADVDLFEELSKMGWEGEQRKRLAEAAMKMQAQA